ncbi:MAG TPA: glycosyltransferase family 4 protein [Thermoanaerobaculia bacterium]|nr:glycosyltransferase family 4 protein [Thermoanaerobaculia bacterium]
MRLLHILSQRPGRSGSGVFLGAMVREARKRAGYEQHAIVGGPPGTTAAELPPLRDGQLSVIEFPSADAPFPVPGNSDVMPYPTTVFSAMTETQVAQYLAAARKAMERVRDTFRPDVVHAHHLWMMTALAREVFADVPVIATSHNAELRQLVKAPHLARHVVPGVRRLDAVCVLTPQSVTDTVDAFGVDPSRIALTGAGFDGEVFGVRRRRVAAFESLHAERSKIEKRRRSVAALHTFTFVGRLSTPKGIPFLLDAVRRLDTPCRLVLAGASGSGADGARIDELVRAADIDVHHTGALPHREIAELLHASAAFVLPSLFEGLPLTMLEALACGTPAIVSGLPTIASWVPPEWVRDGAVELVPPLQTTDADVAVASDVPRFTRDLAAALRRRIEHPFEAREELARRLEPHSWSAVFDRYERIYDSCTHSRLPYSSTAKS